MKIGWHEVTPPRKLTANERAILQALARHARPEDREAARCQAEHASVTAEGTDDCGSLTLSLEKQSCPPLSQEYGVVAEAEGTLEDAGVRFEVLLHYKGRYIDALECYRRDDEPCPALPPAERLVFAKEPDGNA